MLMTVATQMMRDYLAVDESGTPLRLSDSACRGWVTGGELRP